jgi:hypothetical protein
MLTQPTIKIGRAEFSVSCFDPVAGSCGGILRLSGLDGSRFGTTHFDVPAESTSQVAVVLTHAGRAALRAGEIVRVHLRSDDSADEDAGGYRMVMRTDSTAISR